MSNQTNYSNPNDHHEVFEKKYVVLNEIKVMRNQYERLLVNFLKEFVTGDQRLMDAYRVGYVELLEITKGERPPSSLSIFEYMVFSEDDRD